MCIFTGSVRDVSSTAIFARSTDLNRQVLVYSMALVTNRDIAMVLPLPVPRGAAGGDVTFVDLRAYPKFFDDLDLAFRYDRGLKATNGEVRLILGAPPPPRLIVHTVGCFEASFVPTREDFSRLDPRFRLSEDVWQRLPHYDDWGFAVFKLGPMSTRTAVHPMVLEFPRRSPDRLFFPTVHVHQERVESSATFDHFLYCQDVDEVRLENWFWSFHSQDRWQRSNVELNKVLAADRSRGLVLLDRPCYRVPLSGAYPNVDVVV